MAQASDELRRITLSGESLSYRLRRNPRRQRRLAVLVSPAGDVEVRAPLAASQSQIDALLRRHSQWLRDCRERAAASPPVPEALRYADDAEFWYLGEVWHLRLREGRGADAHGASRQLSLGVNDCQPQRVKQALWRWYRQRAAEDFSTRLARCCADLPWSQSVPPLRLRAMRSRWGSCSSRGICLNTRLIQAPPACIDMVIVHELCHLREMNHSPRFYALMDAAMPDWRRHSQRLDQLSAALLGD